jgi:hypothetical protein
MSADPENEYFSDGMTEEIIGALSKVPGLQVASRTSCFSFKGKEVDVRQVGEKLGVASVLTGSVRKVGNRIRITAQLVNAESGYHLWSETTTGSSRTCSDPDDFGRSSSPQATSRPTGRSPRWRRHQSLEAYTLYLKDASPAG